MRRSADMAGMPDVGSHRAFFRCEIVCQDRPLEMKLLFTPKFSLSEMRAFHGPFLWMALGRGFSSPPLCSSSAGAFCGPNSDNRNEVCLAVSRQAYPTKYPQGISQNASDCRGTQFTSCQTPS